MVYLPTLVCPIILDGSFEFLDLGVKKNMSLQIFLTPKSKDLGLQSDKPILLKKQMKIRIGLQMP